MYVYETTTFAAVPIGAVLAQGGTVTAKIVRNGNIGLAVDGGRGPVGQARSTVSIVVDA